jgi:hypothetical protein
MRSAWHSLRYNKRNSSKELSMGTKNFRVIGNTNNGSNLTELNATDAVHNGFMDHADWMAHVFRYAVVMKHVKRKQVTDLLDVGCGRFPLLTYLWRNRAGMDGFDYTGIDLRAKSSWIEEGRLPDGADVELIQMNIVVDDPSTIRPKSVVVCTEMLEHIDKSLAPELVRRLYSWTKPGGYMFLSSPNLGGSDTVADNHLDADGKPREWTYNGKVKLLEQAGFRIVHAMGTFIRMDHLPAVFMNEYTEQIKEVMPNAFFRVFAAVPFPAESNNALFICTRD